MIGILALAVYAAAASLILLAARRWVLPIRPRMAALLAAAPLLLTGKATVTGGVYAPLDILYFAQPFESQRPATLTVPRTPLLSDVACSMIPWQKAREPAVIATSVTAWKGWKARLDGAGIELLSYNHAFLAFRVPAGRHRVDLRYLPDGFLAGMIVSLSTLAGSVFLLRRSPRPESGRRSA